MVRKGRVKVTWCRLLVRVLYDMGGLVRNMFSSLDGGRNVVRLLMVLICRLEVIGRRLQLCRRLMDTLRIMIGVVRRLRLVKVRGRMIICIGRGVLNRRLLLRSVPRL